MGKGLVAHYYMACYKKTTDKIFYEHVEQHRKVYETKKIDIFIRIKNLWHIMKRRHFLEKVFFLFMTHKCYMLLGLPQILYVDISNFNNNSNKLQGLQHLKSTFIRR